MARSNVWNHTLTCTYNHTRNCNVDYNHSCHVGAYCSKNPNKNRDKDITSGQIIYLIGKGYSEEEVLKMSFTEAGNKIREIKQTSPRGLEKVWY